MLWRVLRRGRNGKDGISDADVSNFLTFRVIADSHFTSSSITSPSRVDRRSSAAMCGFSSAPLTVVPCLLNRQCSSKCTRSQFLSSIGKRKAREASDSARRWHYLFIRRNAAARRCRFDCNRIQNSNNRISTRFPQSSSSRGAHFYRVRAAFAICSRQSAHGKSPTSLRWRRTPKARADPISGSQLHKLRHRPKSSQLNPSPSDAIDPANPQNVHPTDYRRVDRLRTQRV